jgi:hypothetical protein
MIGFRQAGHWKVRDPAGVEWRPFVPDNRETLVSSPAAIDLLRSFPLELHLPQRAEIP